MILTQASRQWATRPNDERFVSLPDLRDHVCEQRLRSNERVISTKQIFARPVGEDETWGLEIVGPNGNGVMPSHWSFGQLCALGQTPAGYVRTLPAALAADCLNYGLKVKRDAQDVGLLLTTTINPDLDDKPMHSTQMRAATGPRYGRVWNSQIVDSLIDHFGDGVTGNFKVPGEFGRDVPITKQNTTLYAGDRDMFVFLADEKRRIELPNRRDGQTGSLARGFFVWNSEVGSNTIGAAFFLFDYVCMNRIVWGVQEFKEVRLRHTVTAPDRWLEAITPTLIEYSESSCAPVEAALRAAQNRKIDDVKDFLKNRFTSQQTRDFMHAHEKAEGRPIETLWDVVTGITEKAKTIGWQDQRVELEREAGKILDMAA